MIEPISSKSNIFVVCPAYSKTGGMELLHQLVYTLNDEGAHAVIAYTGVNTHRTDPPTNPEYKHYIDSYICFEDIPDEVGTIVVFPEVDAYLIHKFNHAQIYFWWLSIDNYLKVYSASYYFRHRMFGDALRCIRHGTWRYSLPFLHKRVNLNLVQSYYAEDYLKKHGFTNIQYLSDYINDDYIENNAPLPRENTVLYNPKKGIEFTRKLMRAAPELHWRPLENMTGEQIRHALKTSKVYVDFGNHPGKDRLPREAAISGCCVITGRQGSAGYDQDLPIPADYKFDDHISSIPSIIEKIHECFDDFTSCSHDFDGYREMIYAEKSAFRKDVHDIFLKWHI